MFESFADNSLEIPNVDYAFKNSTFFVDYHNSSSNRHRILFVNESLAGGGAERQLCSLANKLAENGYQVTVATWSSPETPDQYLLLPRIRRFHLRERDPRGGRVGRALGVTRSWIRLAVLIRRLDPDTIISFSDASNILTVAAAKTGRRHVVVSIRNNPEHWYAIKPYWAPFARAAYRSANRVVVQTPAVADWCRRHGVEKTTLIPNMLRGSMPPSPPVAQRPPLLVSVGSLTPRKGHDILLRAFAKSHRANPDWRLMLLGEGSERPALESLANTLGIAKYVTFAGFVKEVDALLATSSIFVLSSRSEGLPNALIEAMAMGNATIAADCDFGPRDIISHGQNGLLVPVDDVGALAEALSALMGDMEQRQMLASQALQVRKRFAADFVTAKWERVIGEVACGEG